MSKKSRKSQSVTVEAPVVVSDVVETTITVAAELPAEAEVVADAPAAEVAAEATVADAPAAEIHPILAIAAAAAPVADAKQKKYPRVGGKCWQVWNACDELQKAGTYPTVKHLRDLAVEQNWNVSNASQEFYAWRKFHGVK
jgi:hypothetical protein